ncbi:phytanoyl-CoA dioxygenase family protein [Paenibacillus montanisoli]|uniref:Phytanoyl-CoA dioxygenase family protein n=1 Tax=Paenibacillus montanisoli TaxID=2081970 RepID=A0A328TZA0_9BACL|nr:phytanoyl-CoA dioxygenase family protein [Paenibacillus montanisoli]RAP75092.1 phytanoyl-CoA dioxygenase family protein [Paenibacillus montanisoli]
MYKVIPSLTTPITQEQIDQFHEQGFLLIKNGCSADLIDAFNGHIYDLRDQDPMPEWAACEESKKYSVRLFNPHLNDGFAKQMMKLPIIRGTLAQLMGREAVGIQSMFFYKEPGSPGQAAHQDFYYIKNDPMTMIAAWIAMEDRVDEENGCLWVIPKSHKLGLLPHGAVKNLNEHEPWTHETEGIDLKQEIPVVMEKGDILFFHELLIHSSCRNRSTDRWRRSYVCHYIREDATTPRLDLQKKFPLF